MPTKTKRSLSTGGSKINEYDDFPLGDQFMKELTVYPGNVKARKYNNWLTRRGYLPAFMADTQNETAIPIRQNRFTRADRPLEIVSPEFYALAGLRPGGDIIAPITKNQLKSIGNSIYNNAYVPHKVAKAINKAVQENPVITAYNRNPATKDIGTLWDYQSYLNEVFPNSRLKDVLWHGSRSKNLETFSTDMIGSNMPIKRSVGMYLSPYKYVGESYGHRGGAVYPVLLNTENPFIHHQVLALPKNGINVARISPKIKNTLLSNNDAVIAPERGEIAFFNPDNALILGSNKDLQGFKTFINRTPSITPENAAHIRTKVGDVEIDNPNLLYHLDRGDGAGAFSNQGAYVKDGRLIPGIAKEGEIPYSWWNLGRPYSTSVNGQPMTRLMTATEDTPGMLHVRSKNYPIGQWNGKRGFVTNTEYVNPKGVDVSGSTYTLDPNYGWKRVSPESPTIKWTDATKHPNITLENAANITPEQWTAAQDAAIARGDMAEAQRLRDLHFKVLSGENPTHLYRGSKTNRNTYYRNDGSAVWLTPDDDAAALYASDDGLVKDLYLKSDPSLVIIDGKGSLHTMIPRELLPEDIRKLVDKPYVNTTEVAHYAKKAGHSQVNFINVKDYAKSGIYAYPQTATRNYENIKLADAVTYDNNGVRIPLGERDNFNINDIRYGLLPFVGITGAAINKRNKSSRYLDTR